RARQGAGLRSPRQADRREVRQAHLQVHGAVAAIQLRQHPPQAGAGEGRKVIVLDRMLVGGIKFVLGKLAAAADAELNDDSQLRTRLLSPRPTGKCWRCPPTRRIRWATRWTRASRRPRAKSPAVSTRSSWMPTAPCRAGSASGSARFASSPRAAPTSTTRTST